MFKTFSAALIAAIATAKGEGTGADRDNAVTTVLLDETKVKLTLHSYNSLNDDGTKELHGDLAAGMGSDEASSFWYENLVYGFCAQVGDSATWDCLKVTTNVNTSAGTAAQQDFTVVDSYSSSAAVTALTQVVKDTTALSLKSERGWTAVTSKSIKECTKFRDIPGGEIVKCTNVNTHFYRDFTTDADSATDTTQDRQLALDQTETNVKLMGFFQDFQNSDATGNSSVGLKLGSVKSDWIAVYPAFKTAVEAAQSANSGALSLASTAAAIAALFMLY